ncbi:Rod shape-determining protein MreB [Oxobacter pfennigii]|uniref:Cell shape-determining protein MreB n=1 Tax=Oxobacter pfennigii TaxID=36849 RepID=A0A0P8W710_9CLOT|nr:rod shape-determining protein [Oxobacter pfennigii]KPU43574.1 Rod shape-determining protein MreB [Oxobacter pfennigii]
MWTNFFSKEMGIDLGTANTLIYAKGKGIVLREPSVVAVKSDSSKEVLAVGDEAKLMIGRTPENINTIRPLKDGVIADFDATQAMLKYFIKKVAGKYSMKSPKIVVCYPSGVTQVERNAIEEATYRAGAKKVYLIPEPVAAAIGAGLPVAEATGSLVVDIGGGTTDIALLSLGNIVASRSLRMAGDELDQSIISYIRREYNLMVGERTAEFIKTEVASALLPETEILLEIRGRDLITGLPKSVTISSLQVYEAIKETINTIVNAVKSVLEETPPELSADVIDRGIILTGGGALLKDLDKLLMSEAKVPVKVADNPLDCVVYGAGKFLDNIGNPSIMNSLLITGK